MHKHKNDIKLDFENKKTKLLVILYKTDITTDKLEVEEQIIINLNQSIEEDMIKKLVKLTTKIENKLQQNKDLILEQYKNSTKPITVKPSYTFYILVDNKYLNLPTITIKSHTHKKGEAGYYKFELTHQDESVLFEQYTAGGTHSYNKTELDSTTYEQKNFIRPTNEQYTITSYTNETLDFKQNSQYKHSLSINNKNKITKNLESITPIKK